jgi:hypothetical protein
VSDPKIPKWHNIKQGIYSMDLHIILQDPRMKAFYNLCDSLTPPTGTHQLLGLRLKFCLQRQLDQDCLHNTLERITKYVCLRFALKTQERFKENNGEYNPRLYILSYFKPHSADDHVKLQLHSFTSEYTKAFKTHLDPRHNLLFYQEHVLYLLQQDARFRIVTTDRNLGPATMELGKYKHTMIKEHLDTKSFKQIFESDARLIIALSRDEARKLTITESYLESGERVFFKRAFKKTWRTALMYGLPKVHKSPLRFRPIGSKKNGTLEFCSLFVDNEIQPVVRQAHGYLLYSRQCQEELEATHLPPNSRLFTADAVGMYSNIDLNLGIQATRQWLEEETKIPQHCIDLTIT